MKVVHFSERIGWLGLRARVVQSFTPLRRRFVPGGTLDIHLELTWLARW
jgi:hypothetical protein